MTYLQRSEDWGHIYQVGNHQVQVNADGSNIEYAYFYDHNNYANFDIDPDDMDDVIAMLKEAWEKAKELGRVE